MRKYLPPARGFDHSLTVYYGQADHYDHSIIGVERIRALREGMPPAARPVDLHRDSVRWPCPLATARRGVSRAPWRPLRGCECLYIDDRCVAVWLCQVVHGHQHVFDQNGTYSGDVFEREAVVILPTQLCCRWSLPKQKNSLGSRDCQEFDWRVWM